MLWLTMANLCEINRDDHNWHTLPDLEHQGLQHTSSQSTHTPNLEHQGLWHSVDYCTPVCRKCTKSVADMRCWNLKCVWHTVSFKTSYFTPMTLILQVSTHHTINNFKFQHQSQCWWCEIWPSKGLGLPLSKFNPTSVAEVRFGLVPWGFLWTWNWTYGLVQANVWTLDRTIGSGPVQVQTGLNL